MTSRRELLAAAAAWTAGPPQDRASDRMGRMTLDVDMDGQGPFRFVLDSAATMSMVAEDVAARLGLPGAGEVNMHTLVGEARTATVFCGVLSTGALRVQGTRLALGRRADLGGVDGLLSPVMLDRRRVSMSFRGGPNRIRVGRTRGRDRSLFVPEHRTPFWSPANHANLVVLRAAAAGVPVSAVLDTGAQTTIANRALADSLGLRRVERMPQETIVRSVTGEAAPASVGQLSSLTFGPLSADRLTVLHGDFHIFDHWGLGGAPAILIGVDVLRAFRSVAIDFGRRDVTFTL